MIIAGSPLNSAPISSTNKALKPLQETSMSFNLIRNARVFFTTNVNATTGTVNTTGFLPTNTYEIQVLDGMSFSQNTSSETITIVEAGATPTRGQRSFNTALDPVDFSMSTYMRPRDGGINITAEESVLWNAMFSSAAIGGGSAAWSETTTNTNCVLTNSQTHQLQKFGLIIILDGSSYVIDNCALDSATVDFGLDAIATIAWAGKGTKLQQALGLTATTGATVTFGGPLTGTAQGKNTTAPFIANKLSTIAITGGIDGTGTPYTVALTGGSLSISNNISYLTPTNLGVVNNPATYFTGTRSITGSLTAYLKTGATNSAGLLNDMLAFSSTEVDPEFDILIAVGGGTSTIRVEFDMPACVLTIPAIQTDSVVSVNINFTAQGSNASSFDIGAANELAIRYYHPNA